MSKPCSVCGKMIALSRLARSPEGADPAGARAARRSTTSGRNVRPPRPAGAAVDGGTAAFESDAPPPLNTRRTRRFNFSIYIICPHSIATHTHLF